MKTLVSFCLMISLFAHVGLATNYYFSESLGNDNWSGRLPSPNASNTDGPKRSLNAFNNLLNSQARPGDSILLRRNDLWSGSMGIVINAASGNLLQSIVIGAYGSGSKPRINKTGSGEILLCRGSANGASSYVLIRDLALTSNSPVGNRPVGVYVNEAFYPNRPHHIILDNLDISGCQNGMVLYQHNIIVKNCRLENNGNNNEGQGIFCSADSVQFLNNVFDNNGSGSVFVHSIYISQCHNILFEGNEIKNADDGLKLRASDNLIIRNNRIHDTYIHTIHVGGDEGSGTKNVIIEGNIVYNAPQGLRISSESGTQTQLSENIIVRNNIFPAQVFISNNGPIKDVFIYNNLVHSGSNQPALLFTNAVNPINLQIRNNIFYKTSSNPNHALVNIASSTGLNGISLENNLYYFPVSSGNLLAIGNSSFNSLSGFRTQFPNQESNGQNGNPNFKDPLSDFHLTDKSLLAIDKGTNMSGIVDFDLDGMLRPVDGDGNGSALWDIGPYEYCCLVANDNISNEFNDLRIYPNPVIDQLHIHALSTDIFEIKISDLNGSILYKSNHVLSQTSIDVSFLQPGIYFIEIGNEQQRSKLYKIIKI